MSNRIKITNYDLNKNKTIISNENFTKIEKPISSVYNIYFSKEQLNNNYNKIPIPKYKSPSSVKRKIPLYKSPFYSPDKINKKINYKKLFPKIREYKPSQNIFPKDYPSSFLAPTKKESLNTVQNNSIYTGIYIRKNRIASPPKRCYSEQKMNFQNNLANSYLTLTPNKITNFNNKKNDNNINKSDRNSNSTSNYSKSNKNQNIININLYNEKNNYIANNIINKIYINRNKQNNSINEKKINNSLNSSLTNNNESINLTDRKTIPRRINYCYYYKRKNSNQQNKSIIRYNNSKKRINNLPKVQRKPSKQYNESLIIKIQSIIRGYLLNKKLDKYLRHFIKISDGIKKIEFIFKNKFFLFLKQIKKNKRNNYNFRNIYHTNKRNNISTTNLNKEKNVELQNKINELINEKMELQNNYDNLKLFVRKYKELEKENKIIKNENEKLKQINNELLSKLNYNKQPILNYNIHKYKKYTIQEQISLNIISPKRVDLIYRKYNLNKEIKNNNKNDFFTLGTGNDDEIEQEEKNESLKKYKLKYLINKKENKIKFLLFKYFVKFYYNGLYSQQFIEIPINLNRKVNINTFNKRYNNNSDISNCLFNGMSIKTLSDNSSVITDRKSLLPIENKMFTNNFLIEDDNKSK